MPLVDGLHLGLYRAIVLDNEGADNPDFLKVRIINQTGSTGGELDVRAESCNPCGMYNNPRKGDKVWVMFEGGNIKFPVWIGKDNDEGEVEVTSNKVIVKSYHPDRTNSKYPPAYLLLSAPTDDLPTTEASLNTGYGESLFIGTEAGDNGIAEARVDSDKRITVSEKAERAFLQYGKGGVVVEDGAVTVCPTYKDNRISDTYLFLDSEEASFFYSQETYVQMTEEELTLAHKKSILKLDGEDIGLITEKYSLTLDTIADKINELISSYNTHVHAGVTSGNASTLVTTSTETPL